MIAALIAAGLFGALMAYARWESRQAIRERAAADEIAQLLADRKELERLRDDLAAKIRRMEADLCEPS